jgi:hypothetical protein
MPYRNPLPASVVASLASRAAPFRAPQYDQTLQQKFWPHVYNELPGTGTNIDRLQVITGTDAAPLAVELSGTITGSAPQKDGDLHLAFRPDPQSAAFPTNEDAAQPNSTEPPLEAEIIYAGPVTQPDAQKAKIGYTNPILISQLGRGSRVKIAGPLIFDRAHGRLGTGNKVGYGLEIHPICALTVLAAGAAPVGGGGGRVAGRRSIPTRKGKPSPPSATRRRSKRP